MLLVTYRNRPVLSLLILFAKHPAQQRLLISLTMSEDVVDDDSERQQTLCHRLAVCAVDGLWGILAEELKSLLAYQLVLDALHLWLFYLLAQGLVDNLVAGIPGDVARYELAVHADGLARYAVLQGLLAGDALEALVEQVDARLFLILSHAATQLIVRVYRGALLLKRDHAQSTAVEHVEAAVLEKSLITAATAFLQYAHGYKDTDGGIGTAVLLVIALLGEKRTEYLLVYVGGHFTVKLVVPGRRIVILAAFASAH